MLLSPKKAHIPLQKLLLSLGMNFCEDLLLALDVRSIYLQVVEVS